MLRAIQAYVATTQKPEPVDAAPLSGAISWFSPSSWLSPSAAAGAAKAALGAVGDVVGGVVGRPIERHGGTSDADGARVPDEFRANEDDMAFVVTAADAGEGGGAAAVSVANDVLALPEDAPPKQRLALSFAIAQSAVLALFEARVERKILEYKYIPEHMAARGRLDISERQLGTMIGASAQLPLASSLRIN